MNRNWSLFIPYKNGKLEAKLLSFLTLILYGSEWSVSRTCSLFSRMESLLSIWTGGWAGLRINPDILEKKKLLTAKGRVETIVSPSHSLVKTHTVVLRTSGGSWWRCSYQISLKFIVKFRMEDRKGAWLLAPSSLSETLEYQVLNVPE